MTSTKDTHNMVTLNSKHSKFHAEKVRAIASLRKVSISRLIAIAVDNELLRDKPFHYDLALPDEEFLDYTYAKEASKILDYMGKLYKGAGLDILCLLRHDIGVPDKATFLAAFKECLDQNVFVGFTTEPKNKHKLGNYDPNYVQYKIKEERDTARKKKKDVTDYGRYLKLKKKFEGDE